MEFDVISDMVKKAAAAQNKLETYSQKQIDSIVKAIAKTVYDNAEVLARMAVEETGIGIYVDKVNINRNKARMIWLSLKGKKSVGVLSEDPVNGIIELAKPMGVVGAFTPFTSPVITPVSNAMLAVKARNSIIIAPHPLARKCAFYSVELINARLKALGAPENIIQTVEEPNFENISELMSAVDVVIAAGDTSVIKSAYESGKPAYGSGTGNVQCIIDRDADLGEAIGKIVAGRILDNGIVCSGEQMIIVHDDDFEAAVRELEVRGAYFVCDTEEVSRLRKYLFRDGDSAQKRCVGRPVSVLADEAGIKADVSVRLFVVETAGNDDPFCRAKMCPVIGIMRYRTFEEAVETAAMNLEIDGAGHSAVIHSHNADHIRYAGEMLKVGRLLVNQNSAEMSGGSYFNGLAAATVFGCGTWGNSIISGNLSYMHLMNITRISSVIEGAAEPSDEEIWG